MLVKQAIDVSFAEGLDTKTDPKRVAIGKFLQLQNTVFTKGGLLQKRNGFASLPTLPNSSYTYLTTLNDNLTAIGPAIAALNASDNSWVSRGTIAPLSVNTLPLLRNNLNQTACDSAVAPNKLVCTAYLESNGTTTTNKYVIANSVTGQNVVAPQAIPVASGTVSGGMRVFVLGGYFIIVFTNTISATAHLQYVAISIASPTTVTANTDLASAYTATSRLSFDGVVLNGVLYYSYYYSSGTPFIYTGGLTSGLAVIPTVTPTGAHVSVLSMCADTSTGDIIVAWTDTSASAAKFFVTNGAFESVRGATTLTSSFQPVNIAVAASGGNATFVLEYANNYSAWSSGNVPTNYLTSQTFAYAAGSVPSLTTAVRSVGLASKAFIVSGTVYVLGAFQSTYQPTYFLINASTSTSAAPVIAAKLAYENGGGYLTTGLPAVTVSGATAQVPYLFKDLIAAANKGTNITSTAANPVQTAGIYSQTGINLGSFSFGTGTLDTAEIAGNLHISGGFLWQYDGYLPVEHNFFLWADTDAGVSTDVASYTASAVTPTGTASNGAFTIVLSSASGVAVGMSIADTSNATYIPTGTIITALSGTTATMSQATTHAISGDNLSISGFMHAKPDGSTTTNAYYYQITYEWTDNQGNPYRSAPSIPVAVTTSGSGTAGSVVLNIPTLRLTMKTANPVKIVVYRWSVGQQAYYQTTSITSPLLNDPTVDTATFVDVNSDATIIGNNLIYTTGGVVEDVNAPASDVMTLFDTRLWVVDAEDRNVLWFSKQVIQSTPVEMSDLFTLYVPPTTSTQGPTGPIHTLAPMDDKLIIGKENSLLYINGTGPDNTGNNNAYSPATFITSAIGCTNQQSIVLTPMGLMMQTDKGIWLLGRDLNTTYIGAPVESFTTGATVTSAVNVPETNQVRFTLSTGVTLMYDYFYDQWGSFAGAPVNAVSSCIYNSMHTTITGPGNAYQESQGFYLDGTTPVNMMFQTGPLRLGDLQNYQRAYFFYLLGTYLSPHRLVVSLRYDYGAEVSQVSVITPNNYSPPYGSGTSQSPYGQGTPYGGGPTPTGTEPPELEGWRVFLQNQRCMALSIQVQEIFDASLGTSAGAGLTLSGINFIVGMKRAFRPQSAGASVG